VAKLAAKIDIDVSLRPKHDLIVNSAVAVSFGYLNGMRGAMRGEIGPLEEEY
jgi:hypothetical protein